MQDITFVISKLLWWPLRPGTAAILLALLGLILLWRGRRWGRWPALAGIGFLGLLALLPLDQPTHPDVLVLPLHNPTLTLRAYTATRRGRAQWAPLAVVLESLQR